MTWGRRQDPDDARNPKAGTQHTSWVDRRPDPEPAPKPQTTADKLLAQYRRGQ